MPQHTFILNGERVTVDVADDVRLLWVLRDVLGVTGPKYGCGIGVCRACTSHVNGRAVTPCAIPVGDCGMGGTVGFGANANGSSWLIGKLVGIFPVARA